MPFKCHEVASGPRPKAKTQSEAIALARTDAQSVCEAAAWTRSALGARPEAKTAGGAESMAKLKADLAAGGVVRAKARASRLARAALATDVTERDARAEQGAMQAARLGF